MQKRRIILVVIAGLIIIAIAFTLINLQSIKNKGFGGFISGLFGNSAEMGLDEIILDSESQHALEYGVSGDSIVYAGNQGVSAINFKGEWLWDENSVSFMKPYIKSKGDYVVVAEIGGKHILLFSKNQLIWKNEFEGKIISADINKDGNVAVAYKVENYNAAISVLKPSSADGTSGDIIFTNKINSEHLISIALSENFGQLLINGFSMEGEIITGSMTFVDTGTGNSFSAVKKEDEIYTFGKYINDETVIAANPNSLRKVRKTKTANADHDSDTELWQDTREMYAVEVVDNSYIITASGSDRDGIFSENTQTMINVMDINGKSLHSFLAQNTVNRIDTGKGLFAISSEKFTEIYNINGEKLFEYETVSEIQKVMIIDSTNFVVQTKKNVYILSAYKI